MSGIEPFSSVKPEKRTTEPNPYTEPMYDAVADYKRKFGWEETIRKLVMMTEVTKKMYVDNYDKRLREQEIEECELVSAELH